MIYSPITSITAADRNARTHSQAQIAQLVRSVREFGWTNPILIDEHATIIAGHGRLEAARSLGMAEVPTITLAGLSDAQRRALALADNKLALNAGWDEALLAGELDALRGLDFDVSLIGFNDDELASILRDIVPLDGMPGLPDGDKPAFQQMTFTLHDVQAERVQEALDIAKDCGPFEGPNENSNGNALARICEAYANS